MTTVNSTSATGATGTAAKPKTSLNQLGSADFLKLRTTQLKQQDPLNPADNTQMLAQMAQFTSLSQTTEMNKGISDLNSKLAQIADKLDAVLTAQQAAKAATPAAAATTSPTTATA
jgi:flagellar basal-body rod modification protein FlgD